MTTLTSSTANMLSSLGYTNSSVGTFSPDDKPFLTDYHSQLNQKNKRLSSFNDDDHQTEGEHEDEDQQGALAQTLKLDDKTLELQKLKQHINDLLKEFTLLLNQLLLLSQGIEMDPSISNALSINLQKLQRNLAVANRNFQPYAKTRYNQETQDALTKAYQHQIDAEQLHAELFEPHTTPQLK